MTCSHARVGWVTYSSGRENMWANRAGRTQNVSAPSIISVSSCGIRKGRHKAGRCLWESEFSGAQTWKGERPCAQLSIASAAGHGCGPNHPLTQDYGPSLYGLGPVPRWPWTAGNEPDGHNEHGAGPVGSRFVPRRRRRLGLCPGNSLKAEERSVGLTRSDPELPDHPHLISFKREEYPAGRFLPG